MDRIGAKLTLAVSLCLASAGCLATTGSGSGSVAAGCPADRDELGLPVPTGNPLAQHRGPACQTPAGMRVALAERSP